MKKLSDHGTIDEIITRIDMLREDSKPLWGKMNPAQMFTHLNRYMELTFGEIKLKRELGGILLSYFARKKLFTEEYLPKNMPTNPYFVIKDERNFEAEKFRLIEYVNKMEKSGNTTFIGRHPFFGKLTPLEWERLTLVHFDHHLRQYGV